MHALPMRLNKNKLLELPDETVVRSEHILSLNALPTTNRVVQQVRVVEEPEPFKLKLVFLQNAGRGLVPGHHYGHYLIPKSKTPPPQ